MKEKPLDKLQLPRVRFSSRLLDSKLSDADRDYLRAAVIRSNPRMVVFRDEPRVRELFPGTWLEPVA